MKKKLLAVPAITGTLLIGSATAAVAQEAPAQEETSSSEDDNGNAGLFGLIGLAGLAGLAGLKRRDTGDRYRATTGSSTGSSSPTR